MKTLFVVDGKNYTEDMPIFVRPSARGIVIEEGKIALVYSNKFDYYKFAGGGIEEGETKEEALCREMQEETGLVVIPDTISPYGMVLRKEGRGEYILVQENYYYFCKVEKNIAERNLDGYEEEERFELRRVDPKEAIEVNTTHPHGKKSPVMIERETRVLQRLCQEGFFTR